MGDRIKRGVWSIWKPPDQPLYKLNIDGSARNGFITGEGVVRDAMGRCVAIFSSYYGPGTIKTAEFFALRDGLELCNAVGIFDLDVESDSQVVVQAISSKGTSNWKHVYTIRQCLSLWKDSFKIKHVYRQSKDLPPPIRKALTTDRLGIWTFRS